MVKCDTVRLLRRCEAGLKMGAASLDGVMRYSEDKCLTQVLQRRRQDHDTLLTEVAQALTAAGAPRKDPSPMAKGMSYLQTNLKMALDSSDGAVAAFVYDGCVMGMKNLQKYRNEYIGASTTATELCDRAIGLESALSEEMGRYL